MRDVIFFDMDETLLHTMPVYNDEEYEWLWNDLREEYRLSGKLVLGEHETYLSALRPSAERLIKTAVDLVGYDNVHILTFGTNDYARLVLDRLELKFSKIFGREDIKGIHPDFVEANCILIDNESYSYHSSIQDTNKLVFLNGLSPFKYVKIRPFMANIYKSDSEEYLSELEYDIKKALKTSLVSL